MPEIRITVSVRDGFTRDGSWVDLVFRGQSRQNGPPELRAVDGEVKQCVPVN